MDSLVVRNICKSYNSHRAVDQISFTIRNNDLFGLLGPNGAGKTTTMRMIMNIIVPDTGEIRILGYPLTEKIKDQLGYLPEERGLYPKMKLWSQLQFLGEMKGMTSAAAKKSAMEWLERFDLLSWANHRIQELSKGMQQKVQFISTILHSPDLIIVDEPFAGLDPINTKFLKDILLEMKKQGKAILLSTHLMDQAEKLCDSICLINKGQVVVQGKLAEIKKKYRHNSVILEYSGNADFIKSLPVVQTVNDYGNYMEIRLQQELQADALLKQIASSNLQVKRFEIADTSLNEIFIDLLGA
jgi:ABC-2 type transport system ATP-binding protein